LTAGFKDTVMSGTFDLIVVGTGAAASTVANRCRAAGWSVAIIDELPYGGTCQLRGCDPKKVLRRGAEVVDAARLLHGRASPPRPAYRLAEPDALQAQLHRPRAGEQGEGLR
jgi:pyruvate/2-oxoglutarate dehydrogenase complex dihydrolipoamide dehydrogenase (E3) component